MIEVLGIVSAIGLTLIWVVYPAAIALLGSLRRPTGTPETDLPTVSVVIATREPDDAIIERTRNVLRTRYPRELLEVIVSCGREIGDGLEGDGEAAVRAVRADGVGKALALNAGVRSATGDVIVFADTYQRFDEDTIPRLVQAVMQPEVGAASGNLQLHPGTGSLVAWYWAFERWLRSAESRVHSTVGATGAVWAIRRSLWQPLRAGLILDDVYGPMRVVLDGFRVAYVANAVAREMRTPTPAQEYRRKVRTLTGVLQLCAWLPAVLLPVRNPIWLQFVFHKLLRMTTPYLLLIVAIWLTAAIAGVAPPGVLVAGAIAIGVAVLLVLVSRSRWAARVRHLAVEGLLIQYAVLVAGLNGIRGNWQVWDA